MINSLENVLLKYQSTFHQVVKFDAAKDKLFQFDFTAANTALTDELITSTEQFSGYINSELKANNCTTGIGGYNENRVLYKRSHHFASASSITSLVASGGDPEEAGNRSIHLGIDTWTASGTKVYAPLGGTVHSFAYNDNFGDYGATIMLQHQLDSMMFHTLYGHVSLGDLVPLQEGKYISRGELIAHVGTPKENGDWPPHLHFQIIEDVRLNLGDYPGVCSITEREKYLHNCPDADLILNLMKFI